MSSPSPLFHVVHSPAPRPSSQPAAAETPGDTAVYAWAPAAFEGAQPPDPVRAALWAGLTATGDRIGFLAPRNRLMAGSVWRETRQGWLARHLRPVPGLLWTGDAEAFDAAFSEDWSRGGQVLWVLGPEARIPDVPPDLLLAWVRTVALNMPPMPAGVRLAVRAGTGGGLCTVFAESEWLLERFNATFRDGLDWRATTFQIVRDGDLAATLTRLSKRHAPPETAPRMRWFRQVGKERTRR